MNKTSNSPSPDPTASPAKTTRQRGLLGSSFLVSSMTFLSRILGLIRDIVLARLIGASPLADAFFVAFKIPNFLRRLFAEGAFSQAFVPVLSEYRQQGSHAAVKALVDRVAAALGSVLILVTVLAVVGAPALTTLFAPGFWNDEVRFAATSEMIRITFPYLLLISLTGLAGGILNSYDRFAIPAFTPVWLNVSLITAALVAAPWFEEPAFALAWGVLAAGVIQLLFQLPFLRQLHLLPTPVIDWKHPGVRRILKLMVPALFGVSVSQINLLLDTVIASFLPAGSVSWLYYSDRLSELPLGVFAVALGTVILPNLSRQHAAKSVEQFTRIMDWALRLVLLIAIPAAIALMILAQPILVTLFYYGDVMTQRDIAMASYSLMAYSAGLVMFMLIKILAPGYYARQDMVTPVKIGVIAMVSNMALNLLFATPLHVYWQLGHVGLAAATAAAALINASLLWRGLRKKGVYTPQLGWWRFGVQMLLANGAMAAVLFFWGRHLIDWAAAGWFDRVWAMALVCAIGLGVYLLVLAVTGIRLRHLRYRG